MSTIPPTCARDVQVVSQHGVYRRARLQRPYPRPLQRLLVYPDRELRHSSIRVRKAQYNTHQEVYADAHEHSDR
jgi:hypothetical protein